MLGILMGSFMFMVMGVVWGESLLWLMLMSSFVLMMSSDSLVLKLGLMGELDYVGWSFSLLSFWVVFLAILGSVMIKKKNSLPGGFIKLSLSLLIMFLMSFYVSDFMFFYLSFETCLIPIFFLILGWGYQPERSQAGIYMLFYTLFGSLPLFFLIMKVCGKSSGYMYMVTSINEKIFFFFF